MTKNSESIRPDVIFLIAFGLFFCLWNIGAGSLASWDEALYAQVSKEIARSGDWIHLRSLGQDWYVKPPLGLWATALFYKLFGINELGTRLFSGLCGAGTALVTYFIGLRLFGRRAAFLGAGVLLSSTDYLHFSRWGMLAVPNLFFFSLAILFYLKAAEKPVWHLAFWAACAAGFMTKGPVIVLAPAICGAHAAWRRGFSAAKSGYFWGGIVLAIALALPWHLEAYRHNPKAFLNDFIGVHWLSRAGGAIEGHTGGWYFYIRSLINKYHPWVILLPAALPIVLARAAKGDNGAKLLSVWFLAVFLFFTFAVQTKLRWYVLPMYPAISLACGVFLARFFPESRNALAKAVIAVALVLHFPFSSVMTIDYSSGIKALAPFVASAAAPGQKLYFYRWHEAPAAFFYYDRPVVYVENDEDVDAALRDEPGALFLVPKKQYEEEKGLFDSRGLGVVHATSGERDDAALVSVAFTKKRGEV